MRPRLGSLSIVPAFVRLLSRPDAGDPGGEGAPGASRGGAAVAAAGQAFLKTLSPEDLERALVDDIELDGARGGAEPPVRTPAPKPAPAKPAAAAPAAVDDEPVPDVDAPITRTEDGATWNAEAGRWAIGGKFVAGEPPADAPAPRRVAPAAADGADGEGEEALAEGEEDGDGEPRWTKVVLPGRADPGNGRGAEADLEIEVADPAIAERLGRLKNDGLRRKQYEDRLATLNQRQAELDEVDQHLETDPVGFAIRHMTPERQLDVARALLLEHLDTLAPEIEGFLDNPADRQRARVELRDRQTATGDRLTQARQARATAQRIMSAVEALIPESADPADAEEFLFESRQYLATLAQQDRSRLTPETVPQLLARRIQRFGFDAARTPAPPARPAAPARNGAPPASPTPATARPVSDRARTIADRRPAAADAAASQRQIRTTQVRRAAATRVAPAGVGAAAAQVPVLPPEAKVSIKAASKHIRDKVGNAGWAPSSP